MMLMRKSGIRLILALFLAVTFVLPAEASSDKKNISGQIDDVNKKKKEAESNLKDAESKVNNLQGEKSRLESYLSDLNSQLMEISSRLDELEGQISAKEEEIVITEEALLQARIREEEQYEAMKKRIKFMYENGETAYLELLLESQSLSEALNRAEYVTKIYDYDRNMLEKYQNTKQEIAEQEALLIEEQQELLALRSEVEAKQAEVGELVASTSSQISKYSGQIASAEKKAKEYEARLAEEENKLENLKKIQEEQKAAAAKKEKERQAAQKEAAEKKKKEQENGGSGDSSQSDQSDHDAGAGDSGSGGSSSEGGGSSGGESKPASAGDTAMLAALIQCEAESESMEGKLAVGSVVMNRVRSSSYPNTVVGVIYQGGQFGPVASGRFALVLAQGAGSSSVSAAQKVLGGYSAGSWLYFKRANDMIDGTVIGNHVFY